MGHWEEFYGGRFWGQQPNAPGVRGANNPSRAQSCLITSCLHAGLRGSRPSASMRSLEDRVFLGPNADIDRVGGQCPVVAVTRMERLRTPYAEIHQHLQRACKLGSHLLHRKQSPSDVSLCSFCLTACCIASGLPLPHRGPRAVLADPNKVVEREGVGGGSEPPAGAQVVASRSYNQPGSKSDLAHMVLPLRR